MPQVSVIIPNYNHAKFLVQRIESVLNQTYQDFEVIILDDCSTDNSKSIISNYKNHPKISQIIFNSENSGGPFYQWERGINLAKGKYVWIAESDDWCELTLLQELVDGIEKDDKSVISYCQLLCVNEDDEIKWQSKHSCLLEIVESENFIKDYLALKVSIFNASMAIFKKDIFNLISKDFVSYKFCGDWFFWLQIARHGKTAISGKVLNYFRKHDNDVSGKAYKSGLNLIEEIKITNWMFADKLIDEKTYVKAFKKQYKSYFKARNAIDKVYKTEIESLLAKPVSKKVKLYKFLPSAIWNSYGKD